jgi:hypothetical protein
LLGLLWFFRLWRRLGSERLFGFKLNSDVFLIFSLFIVSSLPLLLFCEMRLLEYPKRGRGWFKVELVGLSSIRGALVAFF